MMLDVHVAFLVAALCVLFGITYTIGKFLDHKISTHKQNASSSAAKAVSQEEIFLS